MRQTCIKPVKRVGQNKNSIGYNTVKKKNNEVKFVERRQKKKIEEEEEENRVLRKVQLGKLFKLKSPS